jgi:hypothetical protein
LSTVVAMIVNVNRIARTVFSHSKV